MTLGMLQIKQWLENHNTSPRTGNELPDKILRPNHVLRAQIVEFRERKGLPALPPWEPDPQEVVNTAPQMGGHHNPGGMGAGGPPGLMIGGTGGQTMMHPAQMLQGIAAVLAACPALSAQLE
eukprot:COSAG05_NODE_7556_length_797_cov_0.988539_1_plen_121_part_10